MSSLLQTLKHALTQRLREHTPATLLIGLSGGIDSVVLLHALVTMRDEPTIDLPPLVAMHVNHGISKNAADWQAFCETLCALWDVAFQHTTVNVEKKSRTSLEAVAREKRYDALLTLAKQCSAALLTAHHSDDQAETVLLQLKRGSGPKGLSGMAACSLQSEVEVWRPLLAISRADIEQYANEHQLKWIDDESNADTSYERNFLRHRILPLLQARWPGFSQTVSRSAALCASQQQLLEEVCDERLKPLITDDGGLLLTGISEYAIGWQQALVRRWIEMNHHPMPSAAQVEQILLMQHASADRQPEVVLGLFSVRRFRNKLYLVGASHRSSAALPESLPLSIEQETAVSETRVFLSASPSENAVTLFAANPDKLKLEAVSLTMPVKPLGLGHHKPLKQWCKLWEIPPWQREQLVLVWDGDSAVALLNPSAETVVPLGSGEGQNVYLSYR